MVSRPVSLPSIIKPRNAGEASNSGSIVDGIVRGVAVGRDQEAD
jgi:hypothetical protein